ncbi:hypothetical protein SEPCBS119000_004107 [Sporothrix epigloea]|uniref:Uncharacterized protein n=1 Tax=Sporothrix epigloea TaxID=1892477 RepID=A0ABP0DQB7_9PEZI
MAARLLGRLWLALNFCAVAVTANVEKTIFVASPAATDDADRLHSGIADVLPRLTPDLNAWRTIVPAAFPWADGFIEDSTTWILLGDLVAGQRYELRVCWTATQPTAFTVDVYDFKTVVSTVELAASLYALVLERSVGGALSGHYSANPSATSLLRITAAADFVAADRTAMKPGSVPPVLVDIILDPYLFNVLPRSLVPVVAVILAVAAASAWLARRVILPGLRAAALTRHLVNDDEKARRKVQ